MSDKTKTQGAPSWTELMTNDPESAREFYSQLFGWEFETMPMPDGEYHVASVAGETVAGICNFPPQAEGAPPCWGQYITVNDVDATAEKVEALGGKIIVPPTDIPSIGRFTMFTDPQGAAINAISYLPQE